MPPSNQPKIPTFGRCTFHTQTGRRCRSLIVFPDGRFCLRHIHTQSSEDDVSLSLTDRALDFRHPRGIHNALRGLYLQLATGQISARRAATLAYISNLLMRHLRASQKHDPTACHCVGFPHLRHAAYPAPAPEMPASEKSAPEIPAREKPTLQNSAAENKTPPRDQRDDDAPGPQLPRLLANSHPPHSENQPDSANLD